MSLRVLTASAAAVLTALNPISAFATPSHPTSTVDVGSALPPLSEVIGTESHTEMGEVNIALARDLLADIDISDGGSDEPYNRSEHFGTWADPDGNGCDTRNDILARDLTSVAKKAEDGCTVLSGNLADPYTGQNIEFTYGVGTSSDVQIDHIVALSYAWQHGAEDWTKDERVDFANDPDNLVAVDGPANGSKSDAGPGEWMPPNEDYQCTFSARFAYGLAKYDLSVTEADHTTMQESFDNCPNAADEDGGLIEDDPSATPTPSPSRTETSPSPSASPSAEQTPTEQAPSTAPETQTSTPREDDADPEESPEVAPVLHIDPETIAAERFGSAGGGVTISAEHLEPGESYHLRVSHSEAAVSPFTTELVADDNGAVAFTVRAHGQVFSGVYDVSLTGGETELTGSFTVTGAQSTADPTDEATTDEQDEAHGGQDSDDELPYTGVSADVIGAAVTGVALMIAGAIALAVTMRRANRRE